jgi:hypothetical protein
MRSLRLMPLIASLMGGSLNRVPRTKTGAAMAEQTRKITPQVSRQLRLIYEMEAKYTPSPEHGAFFHGRQRRRNFSCAYARRGKTKKHCRYTKSALDKRRKPW